MERGHISNGPMAKRETYTSRQQKAFKRKLRIRAAKLAAKKNVMDMAPSKMPHDAWTSKTRNKLLGKENEAERIVEGLLMDLGVLYYRERPIEIEGKRSFIDFMVVSMDMKKVRIAIEVDGGYHFTPEQQERDRERDHRMLKSCRVNAILRISSGVARKISKRELKREMQTLPNGVVRKLYDP